MIILIESIRTSIVGLILFLNLDQSLYVCTWSCVCVLPWVCIYVWTHVLTLGVCVNVHMCYPGVCVLPQVCVCVCVCVCVHAHVLP